MGTWLQIECPYCEMINWIVLGDLSDQTAPDIDSCRCHDCSNLFWLYEACQYDDIDDEPVLIEDSFHAEGRISPIDND